MAKKVLNQPKEYTHEAAVRLADKIKAGALPSPFTAKIVYDKGWHGLGDRQEVDAACNILIDEEWLKKAIKPKPATGRTPLPEYYINPVFPVKHATPAPAKPAKPHLDTLDTLGCGHFQKKNNDAGDSIEVKPDSGNAFSDALPPTRLESTLARNEAGAGENKITQAPESRGNHGTPIKIPAASESYAEWVSRANPKPKRKP